MDLSYKEMFDSYDEDNTGLISGQALQSILLKLGHPLPEILPSEVTFDEFIELLSSSESVQVEDFLQLLDNYRKDCERDQNYPEARKAKAKYNEIRKKETLKRLNDLKKTQEKELRQLSKAHKKQFEEFSAAWESYMADYESTAYLSLEKLKEKHMVEFQQFHDKVLREATIKAKHSKQLLEIRKKQEYLAKQKKYAQAEEVKDKADKLEEVENAKNDEVIQKVVRKREKQLKKEQQVALEALLKRIERDRNEQIKHRDQDSQRLLLRNNNIKQDVINRQNLEAKRTIDDIKRNFAMKNFDIKYSPQTASYQIEKT